MLRRLVPGSGYQPACLLGREEGALISGSPWTCEFSHILGGLTLFSLCFRMYISLCVCVEDGNRGNRDNNPKIQGWRG